MMYTPGLEVNEIAERVADWFRLRDDEGLQAALRNLVVAVEARRAAKAARAQRRKAKRAATAKEA